VNKNRYTLSFLLGAAAFALMMSSLYLVFLYAPVEAQMGPVQKIFYFHVACAWNAFLAFFIVFIAGIAYLKTRRDVWDHLAAASAELGIVFCTLVLLTGPVWAKSAWNTWWTWDSRLTTTLVLWFLYVGYLVLRSALSEEPARKSLITAVYGIIAFIDVPIVFMSVRWWRSIHPIVIESKGWHLEKSMTLALLVSVAAFSFLYFFLLRNRMLTKIMHDELERLSETIKGGFRP